MLKQLIKMERATQLFAVVPILAIAAGCSQKPPEPIAKSAGFLSSYDKLKPNPNFENTFSYVRQDDVQNVHRYFAVIVEPVRVFVSTNVDVSKLPDRGRTALATYFQMQ